MEALAWRYETIRRAGGVSMQDIIMDDVPVPEGFWFDPATSCYVPKVLAFLPIKLSARQVRESLPDPA